MLTSSSSNTIHYGFQRDHFTGLRECILIFTSCLLVPYEALQQHPSKLTSLFISGWTLYLTRTSFKLSNLFCIKLFLNILILVTLRLHNELLTSIFRIWWPTHGVQRHDNVLALNSFLSLVRMSLKTTFTVKLSNLFCIKIHVFNTWTGNTSFL